ncbi:MAG: molybdopterin-dependent oxidoreductase [Ignavibacteriales bacterium]|nr:molybdopterin-dependent oxidoreductase [Ignavibacteriales bacterium]
MKNENEKIETGNNRREFLKTTALLGGGAVVLSQFSWAQNLIAKANTGSLTPAEASQLSLAENIVHSVCLQCNTGCGIKVKLLDGVAVKIEGNPYSPWTMVPSIPFKTPLSESANIDGSLCPKGQAGLQTTYDPYRIVKVLKRDGKRGEKKWKAISFEQAVTEIVNGGKLFSNVKGEENRTVEGLKSLFALKDLKVAKEMSAAVDEIRKKKTVEEKKTAVEEFKKKFAQHLDTMIDAEHPDFGPKNNQVSFVWGRLKAGRAEFIKRFISESFGSTNAHGHTTVCQGSLYFTGKAMSDQFVEGKLTGGQKFYWQTDTGNVEFLLAIGSAYIEGGYGPTHHAKKLMKNLVDGKLKIAVVDPRFSKIASKAYKWIPIKPGTDAAFALAMIRWIIENKKFDVKFLESANKAAATKAGELSWTNSSWLVKEDGSFLRASEIKLAEKEKRQNKDGKEWEFDPFVVLRNGQPIAFDPNDDKNAVTGDLLVDTKIGEFKVKTGLQLVYESAAVKTIEQWADICGIEAKDIIELAVEFTSHGKKAVADPHRGVAQHTNGFYNVLAVYTLNALIGNWDWKGGLIKATTYSIDGSKEGNPFVFGKMHPNKITPLGISIIRHDVKYEESTIFSGYPAKRQWYPFASDIYEEIIPSMADAYPYPSKVLFTYMAAAPYSLPGGQTNIEILTNLDKVSLYIANDITIGEMSMYADYIFPDVTYLERWEFHGSHPSIPQKVQPVRNPVIAPLTTTAKVFGEEQPLTLETMILGIAEKLNLPGFGKDGLGKDRNFYRAEDFYLPMVANIAAGDKPGDEVPDATDEELKIFEAARKHLPKTVFDVQRWKAIVGEQWWKKVVFVMNRGGRFQDYEKAFEGEKFKNKYGQLINVYLEKYVKSKSAITGKKLAGIASYFPIADVTGKEVNDEPDGFKLHMITFRDITQTKSRTIVDYWLSAIRPENFVMINSADAKQYGFKEGDKVKFTSKSNPEGVWDLKNGIKKPMIGKVKVVEGIRPGIIGFSLGHGHWANGSSDVIIDGKKIKGDPRRATGVHANAAMRLDDYLKNTCLLDPVGGSVSFYDTKVKLTKV